MPFYDDQVCRCNLNADIAETASVVPASIAGKKHNPSDHSAKLIVACAINCNYGIISEKKGMFLTPSEIGVHYGVTCLDLMQFITLY